MDSSGLRGIVHIIGPELGLTQPGGTIVCGDSHTSTHGAFGALAFGIGTSEVEHVLATQCLPQNKPLTMKVETNGALQEGVTAKDLALGIIGRIGTDGATGYVIEYAGEAVRSLTGEEITAGTLSCDPPGRLEFWPRVLLSPVAVDRVRSTGFRVYRGHDGRTYAINWGQGRVYYWKQ